MGLYDREYVRDDEPGIRLGQNWSIITWMIVINVVVYIVQVLYRSPGGMGGAFTAFLALWSNLFSNELLTRPWRIAELVTYGFAHDPSDILHIAFNLFFLWMFGRQVETRYGSRAFLGMYLTALVVAGLVWLGLDNLASPGDASRLIGASGGVSGVIALFVLLFPKQTVYLWGAFAIPTWLFGLIWILGDIKGAVDRSGNVAYTAHLAGAAYGFLFFKTGWSLLRVWPRNWNLRRLTRPKLRVHEPEENEESFSQQVDAILAKINEHGQDSLTSRERKILETASRRYQQKHR